jgi:ADP-ribose pyrophosphatase YjhB (NUDIX family)
MYNQDVKFIPWKKYQKTIPKKRMSAGVLFFNKEGMILILKPSYKDNWTLPGGVCNKNESPRQTGEREVKEEINIEVKLKRLVAVNYNRAKGDVDENMLWWFYGGILDERQIKQVKVDGEEILEYRFVKPEEAKKLVRRNLIKYVYKKVIKIKIWHIWKIGGNLRCIVYHWKYSELVSEYQRRMRGNVRKVGRHGKSQEKQA